MSNLETCPDCGNQVSKRAKDCPFCGSPISNSINRLSTGRKIVLAIICILVAAFCVAWIVKKREMDELKYKAEVARMNSESAREATERLQERIQREESAMQTIEYLSNK